MADIEVQMANANIQNPAPPKKAPSVSKSHTNSDQNPKQKQQKVIPPGHAGGSGVGGKQAPPEGVNKEVLLILRDLNEKMNTQNERIQKQDDRIDLFLANVPSGVVYDHASYDQDCQEFYDYEEQYEYDEEPGSRTDVSEAGSKTPAASSSIFKSLAGKFQQTEPVDNEVNDDLANFVNGSFRNGITEEKHGELLKNINRPVNCESLTKTRVNQGVWRLLKANTQADDSRMQTIQNTLIKAACNVVKLVDKSGEKFDAEEMDWGSDALALLGQANKLINIRRKDHHKSDLDPKYQYLASSTLPYTEFLYGEDVDFNKNVREINDMSRVGRNIRGGGYPQQRGFRGRRFFPYARRGSFRGRGNQRRFDPAAKNLRVAPKK